MNNILDAETSEVEPTLALRNVGYVILGCYWPFWLLSSTQINELNWIRVSCDIEDDSVVLLGLDAVQTLHLNPE
jgi:hypothetical protein